MRRELDQQRIAEPGADEAGERDDVENGEKTHPGDLRRHAAIGAGRLATMSAFIRGDDRRYRQNSLAGMRAGLRSCRCDASGAAMGLHLVIGNKNYSSWSLRPWIAMKVAGIRVRRDGDLARCAGFQGAGGESIRHRQGAGADRWRCAGLGIARDPRISRGEISGRTDLAGRRRRARPCPRRSPPRCMRGFLPLRRTCR